MNKSIFSAYELIKCFPVYLYEHRKQRVLRPPQGDENRKAQQQTSGPSNARKLLCIFFTNDEIMNGSLANYPKDGLVTLNEDIIGAIQGTCTLF